MATEVSVKKSKKTKEQLHAEILKKLGQKERNPDKALDAMYGLWEGRDVNIEKLRQKNTRNKWL